MTEQMTDDYVNRPAYLRHIADEMDDGQEKPCTEASICREAAEEIERLRKREADSHEIIKALEAMKETETTGFTREEMFRDLCFMREFRSVAMSRSDLTEVGRADILIEEIERRVRELPHAMPTDAIGNAILSRVKGGYQVGIEWSPYPDQGKRWKVRLDHTSSFAANCSVEAATLDQALSLAWDRMVDFEQRYGGGSNGAWSSEWHDGGSPRPRRFINGVEVQNV